MAYASVSVEGGFFPSDLLDRIAAGDSSMPGQRQSDFGVNGGRRLTDEIQSAFSDARSYWDAFQRRLDRSRESRTTITREDWVSKFMELLGFDSLIIQRASTEVGSDRYFISHRAGDFSDAPPVHVVAIDQRLDQRDGPGRRSPHALVQEYLNRSDALWGIVTNGGELRLLRDTARLSKPTYLGFDLAGMMEGNLYSEFVLLYRLLHATRFPREAAAAHECFLEQCYQRGIDEGSRVRDKLRLGVHGALETLGNGFLAHHRSEALRGRFETGELDASGYYRQLLRLVYRLLFLMVAEERRLIFPTTGADTERQVIYTKYYGVSALRERADRYFAEDQHTDLWLGLSETFHLLRDNDAAGLLGLSALNGELFSRLACANLENATCTNENLLSAIRELSTFREDGGQRRRVNYAGLDVEEFGSVYESLLDFHPQVTLDPSAFRLVAGSERKQTGSYYTPPELVRELIESALVPVMQDRLRGLKTREEREAALLDLRVCDPASGSGHFLLAAARRIARELATVRSGEETPSPDDYRTALRDVIRQCIYAVDKNPLAVDLCKVALWIEGHNACRPLSFLDNHIKCGDSLVGVFNLSVLDEGIPDEAYKPVTGDDKAAATFYRKRNQAERKGAIQLSLANTADLTVVPETLAKEFQILGKLGEQTPDDVQAKESLYGSLRGQGTDWWRLKVACDLWTAAFFLPLEHDASMHMEAVSTTGAIHQHLLTNSANDTLVGQAVGASQMQPFFHWPLEFPEVFERGGFDVVLGNPPWERIKIQEKEFFAARDPDIASAPNKAARERLIKQLPERNPALATEFATAKHNAEAESRFVRGGGRFSLTGKGDINTYSIFAETARTLLHPRGWMGMIVPSGIATDDTTKDFFGDLVEQRSLVSLHSFENEAFIFPEIHHATKFCLLTMSGAQTRTESADLVFFARRPADMQDMQRHFTLRAEDFHLINPNTHTCPTFRTLRDADIVRGIYQRVPVLINERANANPWGVGFLTMLHMANDSGLFQTEPRQGLLTLYEGKMIHQFDHRFGTYEGQTEAQANQGKLPELSNAQHADPWLAAHPRYWVRESDVDERLEGRWDGRWLLGWREVTSAVTTRTVIASLLPRVGVGHKVPLLVPSESGTDLVAVLLANLNAFVLDYVARQKVGGTSLSYFHIKQLPILAPDRYGSRCEWSDDSALVGWLAARVLELVYTSWDVQPFAQDMGYDGPPLRWDSERRHLLRCELDATFFHLYQIDSSDIDYIMDTFPIVKRKDEQQHGEYRTKRVILEIYDDMARAMRTGESYRTRLDPPPADPRVAHPQTKEVS